MTTRPKGITDDQIVAAVKRLTAEKGGASYRELATALGYQSPTAIRYRIVRLAEQGLLERNAGEAKAVRA
jgi:DNA-binding Lrp family transcriptional regulator